MVRATPISRAKKPEEPSEARAGLEMVVLQQIADSLQQTNAALHDLNENVQQMAIKVNTLETHDLASKFAQLRAEVDAMKLEKAETNGAIKFRKWLVTQIPWIVTLGVAVGGWWYNTHIKPGVK